MTVKFAHETLPQRVVFASFEAAEHVTGEVARLGASRPMVIAVQAGSALADPVGAENSVTSRGLGVFVDQAAEPEALDDHYQRLGPEPGQ